MSAPITTALALLALSVQAHAQWARVPDRLIPRTASGEPDLAAPAPRMANGRPNLSGVWMPDGDPVPAGVELVEGSQPIPRHMIDITADLAPEDVQLLPEAAAIFNARLENRGIDSPLAYCRPTGVPFVNAIALPYKIVQTPELVLILYEENTVFRQIFLDGRATVEDPVPRWMGYSTGRWDGDTLVVETVGLTEDSWLDGMGHPHTEQLRVIERLRRTAAGHLTIETTIDDPGAYRGSITYTLTATAVPDDDLLEYFCSDNEKSSPHYQ